MSLHVQFATLGAMFLSGLFLGLAFDLIRSLSWEFRFPKWIISLLDLVYWAAATWFVFRVLFNSNSGQLRFFVFIGLGIGVCFYFGLLSLFVMGIFRRMIRMTIAVVRFGIRVFELFVVKPLIYLYRFMLILGGFFVTLTIFLFKIVIQLLYPLRWTTRLLFGPLVGMLPLEAWRQKTVQVIRSVRDIVKKGLKRLF